MAQGREGRSPTPAGEPKGEAVTEPREWAERIEHNPELPDGDAERSAGYAVMSLPFASGHVLALRRWPASSFGPPYTSVWHRSPQGDWTFYSDVPAMQSCPRYFGAEATRVVRTPIELSWAGDNTLSAQIGGDVRLDWEMTLAATVRTRLLNATGGVLPDPLWRQRWVLALMGRMASLMLGAGRIQLHGHTPNAQWFLANPRLIWTVATARASLGELDLGPTGPLERQARLADFWLPQRGLFAVARAFLEPLDPRRHVVADLRAGDQWPIPAGVLRSTAA